MAIGNNHHYPYVFQLLSAWTLVHLSPEELQTTLVMYVPSDLQASTQRVVDAIIASVSTLDDIIQSASPHRNFQQLSANEKSILRIATWELQHSRDISTESIKRQCIQLISQYTPSSIHWINGRLQTIATICRPTAIPSQEVLHV